MTEYFFDPGYSKHLVSLVFSLEDMYSDINKFKNLNQKKFYFKQYYPGMIKHSVLFGMSFMGSIFKGST